MPHQRKTPPPLGRFTQQAVRAEIERRLAVSPKGTAKLLAAALGSKYQSALNKRQEGHTPWTVEDLGRIADVLDPDREHPGWPFVPWDEPTPSKRRGGR
jgi:hypothetical protein